MANLNIKGLEEFKRKLEKVGGKHDVSSDDLFTNAFMRSHTNFGTWKEMVDASGIANIDEVHSDKFSSFVSEHSKFSSMEEMEKRRAPNG